ncbi:hypothetical protein GCM10010917_38990 [Paenibacillus physcomitrellae]|uniref:Uncharacterized protein n=1 Tax=Paenibacillus physcomitrellae TaxID=1619311 RepID=A0ABQ1GTN5_9BACL|nr:hypothetical protein GCM10010917_38990 [Paenibacillus physcomitrellae]
MREKFRSFGEFCTNNHTKKEPHSGLFGMSIRKNVQKLSHKLLQKPGAEGGAKVRYKSWGQPVQKLGATGTKAG